MTDYTKNTNFTTKDALASGDANKVIKGSEFDAEFDEIATASATKANKVVSPTNGNLLEQSATGDLADSGILNTAGVLTNVTSIDGSSQSLADTNGVDAVLVGTTASAVNEVTVTNAVTTAAPSIAATGDDANIDLDLNSKGTGTVNINSTPVYGMVVLDTPVLLVNGSATTGAWTLVDMSTAYAAAATAGATKAIIKVTSESTKTTATSTYTESFVRKTGSGLAANELTKATAAWMGFVASNTLYAQDVNTTIVNLDSNSDFDWNHDCDGTSPVIYITLVGYYV